MLGNAWSHLVTSVYPLVSLLSLLSLLRDNDPHEETRILGSESPCLKFISAIQFPPGVSYRRVR